jgi:cephalosporin hydroxylase
MSHDPLDPERIAQMGADPEMRELTRRWFNKTFDYRYPYNFSWLGRPIIQYPQDVMAMQEIIWKVKPRAIVETGIAHGGSLILSASLLELVGGDGIVVGVDIDIRDHNRAAIEAHPLARRIQMIQGSAIDESVVAQVRGLVGDRGPVLVILDSNHTHHHVAEELKLYSPMVQSGSYLIVFDTVVEFMKPDAFPDRPWGIGDNPYSAVQEFLKTNSRFQLDQQIEDKLQITVAPGGWLKCVADG